MNTPQRAPEGRLDELVAAMEALPEAARAPARDLLALVLDLHGGALRRILDTVAADAAAAPLIGRMTADDQVRAVLLIHGLHPEDVGTRVREALQGVQARLDARGLRAEAVEVSSHVVRIRVAGDLGRGRPPLLPVQDELRALLHAAAPDVARIEVEVPAEVTTVRIPVESLRRSRGAPAAQR